MNHNFLKKEKKRKKSSRHLLPRAAASPVASPTRRPPPTAPRPLLASDDEDTTSSDITMTTLCINQPNVHMFYIRFICYIFEQTLLHNEFCVFSFAEILAWAKEKRPSVTHAWMIKEVDWGLNQDLLQVYFYFTTSLLVHKRREIKFYTFCIRIRAS